MIHTTTAQVSGLATAPVRALGELWSVEIQASGSDTVIQLDGTNVLTLSGVDVNTLTVSDFLIDF